MNDAAAPIEASIQTQSAVPAWLIVLMAGACGLLEANIYYAQPLAGPIAASLGLSPRLAGLTVTMSQVGYCMGLLFVVPLGDLIENRPALSRWSPDHAASFAAFMAEP